MSNRFGFVTSFLYCDICSVRVGNLLRQVREEGDWRMRLVEAKHVEEDSTSRTVVFSGTMSTQGEEKWVFDEEGPLGIRDRIESAVCHPMSVAIACEGARGFWFHYKPVKEA